MDMQLSWPPDYQLRRSVRARRINLYIDPIKGLEIVLPKKASQKEALDFLNYKRRWVEHHLEKLAIKPLSDTDYSCFPALLELPSINVLKQLRYHHLPYEEKLRLHRYDNRLIIAGPIKDVRCCVPILKTWIARVARRSMLPLLRELSDHCCLPFDKLSLRNQKTMWGSCSKEKNISLNYKLLFLPTRLLRYVMVHELCHTKHFNHSVRFWSLVAQYEPNYLELRRELKCADKHIPRWFYYE